EHLHRFDDDQHAPGFDCVARSYPQVHYHAGERRAQQPAAANELIAFTDAAPAAPAAIDLIAAAADLEVEDLGLLLDQHLDDAVVQREDVAWRVTEALQADGAPGAVQVDAQAGRRLLQLRFDFAVVQPQEILRQRPPRVR